MPCLDVEAEAIQQAVDRRELQSAGMGLVSPGVASSSGVVWFLLGFGFSWGFLCLLDPPAAPLDPEEEVADWLLRD